MFLYFFTVGIIYLAFWSLTWQVRYAEKKGHLPDNDRGWPFWFTGPK